MKKALISTITTIVLITSTVFASSAITVRVNNQPINLKDAAAFVDKSNRTLVPLRFIADNLDAQTDWDQQSKTTTVTQGDKVIKLCIPCKKLTINGEETSTDSYGLIKNNRTYVPLRLIAEAFGAKVSYKNRIVDINTDGSEPSGRLEDPDTSKMNKLSQEKEFKGIKNDYYPETPLYDGANFNWNVRLVKEGVNDEGFGILYTETRASALYAITSKGEWLKAAFPFPNCASYPGNHIGKEIDKIYFSGRNNDYLVDIENFIVEK